MSRRFSSDEEGQKALLSSMASYSDDCDIPMKLSTATGLSSTELEDGFGDDDDYSASPVAGRRRRRSGWRRFVRTLRRRPSSSSDNNFYDSASLLSRKKKLRRSRKFSVCGRLCIGLPVLILCMLGIVHILDAVLGLGSSIWDTERDDFLPNWGQPGQLGEGLASYPTDFTRDVVPIPCHSHNDYWRRVPLYQALHYGCTGVEADVWLFAGKEDLYVGHNTASLTANRTFLSLYVNPLVEILDRQNQYTDFANASRLGVFDEDPFQTVVLLVDFKTDGPTLLPVVLAQLEPLRSKGYLSYYDGASGQVVQGPITVVATGNAPFDLIVANTNHRDIFFDAPLASMFAEPTTADWHSNYVSAREHFVPNWPSRVLSSLNWRRSTPDTPSSPTAASSIASALYPGGQGSTGTDGTTASSFNATNSFYASTNFGATVGHVWGGRLSPRQMRIIRGQIAGARRQGLMPRYWGTPSWPIGLRNHVWMVLMREGAAYLNVDDVRGAAKGDWSRRRHGWI